MSVATRAIFTGSTPNATPRQSSITLTSAPHGGGTAPQYPKAVHANGYTYVGYIRGDTGGLYVAQYVHATGITTATLLDTMGGVADTHNNPAVLVRPDGRILVAFCVHDGANVFTRLSTSPHDITAWGAAANVGISSTSGFTYPGLAQLTGIAGDPIYLVIRDKSASTTGRLRMVTSSDGGSTWGSSTIVFAPGSGLRPYWQLAHDTTSLHVMTTDRDAYGSEGSVTVGHMWFDGTTWRHSDGTTMGPPPFDLADLTTVYSGASLIIDGAVVAGLPRFTSLLDIGSSQVTGRMVRWTGSAWVSADIFTTAYHTVDRYYGYCTMNHADPSEVFGVIGATGSGKLNRWVSGDNGATWSDAIPVTIQAESEDHAPIGIVDADESLTVVWLTGSLVSSLDFDFGIMGLLRR